jgi:hypothetical protein
VIAEKLLFYEDMLDEIYGVKRVKSVATESLKSKYSNESMNRQKLAI